MKPASTSDRGRYAVGAETSIVALRQPGAVDAPLTEIAREGARRILASALEAGVEAFLERHADDRLEDGRRRVVRHGHGPERVIQTGIGALDVRRPKVRDPASGAEGADRVRVTSSILPRWARRSRSLDARRPVLSLRGVSTGDVQKALAAILGPCCATIDPLDRSLDACTADLVAGRRHAADGGLEGGPRALATAETSRRAATSGPTGPASRPE